MRQLNFTTLNHQPTTVLESAIPIQTDVTAIDGSEQRAFIQYKYKSDMSFSMLAPADYVQIMNIINTASGVVYYYNNLSDYTAGQVLAFSGLATYKESPYAPGANATRNFDLTIRQL